MEDPWSTPWAVDTPSASPGLTPTKPKTSVTAAAPGGTGTITPVENGIGLGISGGFEHSPWGGATSHGFDAPSRNGTRAKDEEDEDGWGGWDDGKTNTWAGANGEKSIDVFKEPAEEFSAPWGFVDKEQQGEGVTDSAVSFGEHSREEEVKTIPVVAVRDEENKATVLLEDEQDAWTAPREEVAAPSAVIAPVPEAEHPEEPAVEAVEKPISEEEKEADIEQAEQQKSSKVQELVTMYDGFAKKAVRPPLSDTSAREGRPSGSADTSREDLTIHEPASKQDAVVEEDELDLKPHDMDVKSPVTDSESESSTEDDQSDAEDTIAEEDSATTEPMPITADTTQTENADADRESALLSPKEEELHADNAKSNTKAPPYPIDFAHLDALFPGSQASTIRPEPVPDVIIDNSFTTAPERKTWYRISRLGSSRRHDSGDADNYKPLAWADSEVHGKTLQIVRRWMEQDSIAGRVVLGSRKAGPLGASMFNWDSSEPQIEISELLRQRVSNGGGSGTGRHVRNRSLPQADAPPQTPTMEAFGGWGANASMPSTPSAVVQSPAFAAQMKAKSGSALRPPPDSPAEMPKSPWDDEENKEEGRKSADLMPPPPALAVPTVTVVNGSESTQDAPDEDDDDWGEMISSPAVEPSSTFAPLSAPADIKPTPLSQSFDADFSGLDFFESSAPAMTRPNAPPPIRTSGIAGQNKSAVASPIWTPTMNSPALEPIRASMDNARAKSPAGTPVLASTPVLEPRASLSSSRLSVENAWTPTVSTLMTINKSSIENEWTPMATPTATTTLPVKQPASKRVSFEDTCTVDERTTIDEALRSLPDLSYMLR